jgi:hypothetical protein
MSGLEILYWPKNDTPIQTFRKSVFILLHQGI